LVVCSKLALSQKGADLKDHPWTRVTKDKRTNGVSITWERSITGFINEKPQIELITSQTSRRVQTERNGLDLKKGQIRASNDHWKGKINREK
jgi:hypothetical protein